MTKEFEPYVGPRPYEQTDKDVFCGRESESSELLSLVIAHPVVLFYSQSGAGKTSLLNASLVHLLEKEGLEVLPLARVGGLVPEEVATEKIQNIYVFNVLMSWAEEGVDSHQLTEMTILDFLNSRQRPTTKEGFAAPRVAVFDQFEELFTFYPERWGDREEFFDQISEALEEDRMLRVVFAMREDYIAELDPYVSLVPGNLRTRFRLERLREDDALQAVTKPLEGTGYSFAEGEDGQEGVAEQLVANLLKVPVETASGVTSVTSEFVEPVQLQVVCRTLWQKLQPSDDKVITHEHLKAFGDVDQALADFYERTIAQVVQETNVNEGLLRRWFEDTLITPAGTRGIVYRGDDDVSGIPPTVVEKLENHHLIRAELRGRARWYELTHDRLIDPIKTSNHHWFSQRPGSEQTRQRLEIRAGKWTRSGRKDNYLLDEGEWLEAKRWLESPNAQEVGHSDALVALIHASDAAIKEKAREHEKVLFAEQQRRAEAEREMEEEQKRRIEAGKAARRLRRLAAVLAAMFLISAASAVFAVWQTFEAREALRKAQQQEERANRQTKLAEEERLYAIEARDEAEAAKDEADAQRHLAVENAETAQRATKEAEKQAHLAAARERETKVKSLEIVKLKEGQFRAQELENKRKHVEGLVSLAQNLDKEGKFKEALDSYREALSIYQDLNEPAKVAATMHRIAVSYDKRAVTSVQGKEYYTEAEKMYLGAKQIGETLPTPQDKQNLALILNDLAALYQQQNMDAKAEPLYVQALEIKDALNINDSDLNRIYSKLAKLFKKQGNKAKAEKYYRLALGIPQNTNHYAQINPDSPEMAPLLMDLAQICYERGQYEDAQTFYKQVLAINEGIYKKASNTKPFAVDVIEVRTELAELYKKLNKPNDAREQLQRAYCMASDVFGEQHAKVDAINKKAKEIGVQLDRSQCESSKDKETR